VDAFEKPAAAQPSSAKQFWQGVGIAMVIGFVSLFASAFGLLILSGNRWVGVLMQLGFLAGGGILAGRHAHRDGLKTRIAGLVTVLSFFVLVSARCWGRF
jgi:hypothetical protein